MDWRSAAAAGAQRELGRGRQAVGSGAPWPRPSSEIADTSTTFLTTLDAVLSKQMPSTPALGATTGRTSAGPPSLEKTALSRSTLPPAEYTCEMCATLRERAAPSPRGANLDSDVAGAAAANAHAEFDHAGPRCIVVHAFDSVRWHLTPRNEALIVPRGWADASRSHHERHRATLRTRSWKERHHRNHDREHAI